MKDTATQQRNDKRLRKLVAGMVTAVSETLASLVDRPMQVVPSAQMRVQDVDDWLAGLGESHAVIRGALDKDFSGRHLLVAMDIVEAISLSGSLMMTPTEVINERREAKKLEDEDFEAFSEVANILCSGIDTVLRDEIGSNVGLRVKDHGTVSPSLDKSGIMGEGELVFYEFSIKIDSHPETTAVVAFDGETAESWNNGSLFIEEDGEAEGDDKAERRGPGAVSCEEEDLEQIPQADIQARMSAFLTSTESFNQLRRTGRRLGIEIQRHARTAIPNPAAHRGEIVLVEVPVGEEKRFDWAKRIKQHHSDIPVVLLLHTPSRPRVVQGFMTRSNVIIAWPCKEPELSAKIAPLLVGDEDGGGGDKGAGDDDAAE